MRTAAAVSGLLGGPCWLAAFVLDRTGEGGIVDALTWAGIALLAAAVLGAGASLVSRSAGWLQVVVAVCFAVLVASVLEVLRDSIDGLAVYAVFGAVAAVVSVMALVRGRPAAVAPAGHRARGSHAR
jgi:hypothetical protein